MTRVAAVMAVIWFAAAPLARAAAPAAITPDVQARLQQAATKSCNDDLDNNRFGDYASVEECAADRLNKLERNYVASATPRP